MASKRDIQYAIKAFAVDLLDDVQQLERIDDKKDTYVKLSDVLNLILTKEKDLLNKC